MEFDQQELDKMDEFLALHDPPGRNMPVSSAVLVAHAGKPKPDNFPQGIWGCILDMQKDCPEHFAEVVRRAQRQLH